MNDVMLQDIHDRLARIEEKLDILNEFKVNSVASSRAVSIAVSGLLGLATFVFSSLVSYAIAIKSK